MSYSTDRLMKNARNALPGALDNVILLELFNVLDQFFRESRVWTENVAFSVNANDPAGTIYYIEPESVSSIVALNHVRNENGFRQNAAYMPIPGEVVFWSPPGSEDLYLTAEVSLSIVDPIQRDGYPEFPSWVLEKYGTGILSGVLGRMMGQPAKPYTNMQLAGAHAGAFRRCIAIASTESLHRNVQNGQAWMFPQQFSTRRWR